MRGEIEWRVEAAPVEYPAALALMEARVAAIRAGTAPELIWLLEHPPLYTAGTSANTAELLDPGSFPVFATGRGGRYTYHGPGQRVVYVMLDLDARCRDLRRFVGALEDWLVRTLAGLGVAAFAVPDRIGVWVDAGGGHAKIAALGIRVRRWVSFHGIALNIAPDLGHFDGIVACGLAGYRVTSLAQLGNPASLADADAAFQRAFPGFLQQLDGRFAPAIKAA
jgi:lipoyl(octanoyl) transferase